MLLSECSLLLLESCANFTYVTEMKFLLPYEDSIPVEALQNIVKKSASNQN
jgi:hypothetical protein